MRIPFTLEAWLKDKSQKVETRDGRIVHNIWPVKEPLIVNGKTAEVCALIDGEEDALVFFAGGKYLPVNTESPFDLFIVTPEEGLTEFEKAIKDLVLAIDEGELCELGVFEEKNLGAWAVKKAAELLSLAREQFIKDGYVIEKKAFHDAVEKVDPGIMKEVSKNVDMQIALRTEYEKGRADALKDLPRWRKCGEYTLRTYGEEHFEYRGGGRYLVIKGMEILLSDLEKLPKED